MPPEGENTIKLKHRLVFIGTYTEPILFGTGKILLGKGEGIYVYRLDTSTGSMKLCSIGQAGPNPSYLTFDPSRRFMYAVNELKEFNGAPTGAVSAFSVDEVNGTFRFLNRQPSHGTDPCYLTVDKTGMHVLVANFMSGSVCVLPILKDGSLGSPTDVIQHRGSSVDPIRQTGPHAHAVTLDDSGRYAFVPDLGLDRVMIYRFDQHRGKLTPNKEPWIDVPAGSGPRQLIFHTNGKFAYLINELSSTVIAFRYDKQQGGLKKIQTISTLPDDFEGTNTCAELQISRNGKFIYGSNRGHDSIVIYAIDPSDGTLSTISHKTTGGKSPRHFTIDPDGALLLIANQDSDNVIALGIDSTSGALSESRHLTQVPTPVCVKIL